MRLSDFTPETAGPARTSGRDVSRYVVAGVRVPSVTEVLDIAGLTDIQRLRRVAGNDVIEYAAVRGRLVHGYCELVDLDPDFRLDSAPEEARGYVRAYQSFRIQTGFTPQLIEEPMVSSSYRFAGTVDRVGMLFGELWTLDIKTPAAADPGWRIQTAGYAIAVEENFGERTRRGSLQLRTNGTWKLHRHEALEDTTTFIAAVHVAHYRLAHKLAHLES